MAPWIELPVERVSDCRAVVEIAVADFEDDAKVATGPMESSSITASGLTKWNEAEVRLKRGALDSAAVRPGRDRRGDGPPPVWPVDFEASAARIHGLVILAGMTEDSLLDDAGEEWELPEALDIVVTGRSRTSAATGSCADAQTSPAR